VRLNLEREFIETYATAKGLQDDSSKTEYKQVGGSAVGEGL